MKTAADVLDETLGVLDPVVPKALRTVPSDEGQGPLVGLHAPTRRRRRTAERGRGENFTSCGPIRSLLSAVFLVRGRVSFSERNFHTILRTCLRVV